MAGLARILGSFVVPSARLRLWIGAFALFVQILMPVQHVLARGGEGHAKAVLCTAEGSIVVDLADPDGTSAPAGKAASGMLCPLCAIGGPQALLTPTPVGIDAPQHDASTVEFEARPARSAGSGGNAAYGSRAPPFSV